MKHPVFTYNQRRRIERLYDDSRTLEQYLQDIAEIETSEELHQLAYIQNWSAHRIEVARAIVKHPLCDFGTGLQIYWRLEFSWRILQYESRNAIQSEEHQHRFDLMVFIEEKLASLDFPSRRIAVVSREFFKMFFAVQGPIKRKIPDILFENSPGTPCLRDDLEDDMTHEEWRDLIHRELDYAIISLTSNAEEDPGYQPYLDWFVRRNIEGDFSPFTNRISRFPFNRLKSQLHRTWKNIFSGDSSKKNPHLSDDQRRRLHRVLDTSILNEDHIQFVHQMESAEELHQLASSFNWDNGHTKDIMQAIINHPLCDYGTALSIYWMASPTFYREKYSTREDVRKSFLDIYDLLEFAEQKLLENRFASHRIQIDVSKLGNRKRLARQETFKRQIPPQLLKNSPGTPFIQDDLQYEFNDADRYLSVLETVSHCLHSITQNILGNPLFESVAERFRKINLDGMKLKDSPLNPELDD